MERSIARFAVTVALAGFVAATGCGSDGDVSAMTNEQFCAQVAVAIEQSDQSWDREPGDDAEADRQLVSLLRELDAGVPDGAPDLLGDLFDQAATSIDLAVRFADGEDIEVIREDARRGIDEVRAIDWDEAEAWVEDTCGIAYVGIELRMRDDDRTATSPSE